ncbi:MAG: phage major capsid protein [Planctomycetota bacterium]|nr:phage major capsid protein [Planctomycetota bacterium]
MAISTEVLNTTYRRLKGPLLNTFMRRTPLLDAMISGGRVREKIDGGSTIERAIMTGSPATGRGIYNGTELLNLTRNKRTEQLKVEPHRLAAAIAIPKRELAQNDGSMAVMRLIEKYPEAFMKSTDRCLESWFLSGAAPATGNHAFSATALSGFNTLNGDFSTGTLTGASDGLLDFAAESAQGDTVMNLGKSQARFWYNQYEQASSWNSDGLEKLGKLIRRCGHFSQDGKPSLGFADPDTMVNLEDAKRGHVRVDLVDKAQEKSDLHTIDHNGVTFHESLDLERSLSVFASKELASGGGYVINPEYFEFVVLAEAALTDFEAKIASQDVVVSNFEFHAAFLCTHLAAQGAFSRTAL